ncbi:hypothetical protein DXG03_005764, partial [Asterophora parasitica]
MGRHLLDRTDHPLHRYRAYHPEQTHVANHNALQFALALRRSISSLQAKPLSPWKLMLRDGLNLYAAIVFVNLANVIFWFVIKPKNERDAVQTIVTSMAAVLTTSMSLRIVLA